MKRIKDIVEVVDSPKTVSMVAMATVVDKDGVALYHIVSTRWSKIAYVALYGMLSILTIIAGLVYVNQGRLATLESKQGATETRQDASDARQIKSEAEDNK